MKLVFIYGPPAAGKTTVATELSRLTGYPVFPNHQLVGLLSSIFPYDVEALAQVRTQVSRDLRTRIYQAAAASGTSFITTFGMAGPDYFDFFREAQDAVEKAGGSMIFVQLIADKDELLKRVTEPSRRGQKIDSSTPSPNPTWLAPSFPVQ